MRDKTDRVEQALHKRLVASAAAAEEAQNKYGALAKTILPAVGLGIAVTTFNSDLAIPLGVLGLLFAIALYFAPVRTEGLKHDLKLFGRITGIAAVSMILCLGVLWIWPGAEKQAVVVRGPQLEAIEQAAQGGKREESSDPRKELINLGYGWDMGSFTRAYVMGDGRAVELFFKGGLKPDRYTSRQLFWMTPTSPLPHSLFEKYRGQLNEQTCTRQFAVDARQEILEKRDLYSAICGSDALEKL